MKQQITIRGLIATTPRHLVTPDGLPITSFRFAAPDGRDEDEKSGITWLGKTGGNYTNWYTVTAFHGLAVNAAHSLSKGDRVLVTGVLRVRDWDNGERSGTSVEIEAESIGHDLALGIVDRYTRTPESDHPQFERVEV